MRTATSASSVSVLIGKLGAAPPVRGEALRGEANRGNAVGWADGCEATVLNVTDLTGGLSILDICGDETGRGEPGGGG